jgi:hypothetical protein
MPDFGSPVVGNGPTGIQQGLQTISGLMGIRQQQQGLQSGALDIQQKQAQLPAVQAESQTKQLMQSQIQRYSQLAQSKVDENGNSLIDPQTGDYDIGKLASMGMRVAPLAPELVGNTAKTHTDLTNLKAAALSLTSGQKAALMGPIQAAGLTNDPNAVKAAVDQIDAWGNSDPSFKPYAETAKTYVQKLNGIQDPEMRARAANSLAASFQPGQAVQTQTQPTLIDKGGQLQPGVTAPPVQGGGFTPTSAPIDKTVAPGLHIFQDQAQNNWAVNPQDPGKAILLGKGGSLPGVVPKDVQQGRDAAALKIAQDELKTTPPGPAHDQLVAAIQRMQSGGSPVPASVGSKPQNLGPPVLEVGGKGAIEANTADMGNHFTKLNGASESLPLVTSLTKTIQGLAPEAFVGPGQDKRQYWAGLGRVFGFNVTGDAQTDTNLLSKAMAQLNISTPAGTDAARALVEAGQPNVKMDSDAIKEAAGTLLGQAKMQIAERDMLGETRYKNEGQGDPAAYQQKRQWFEHNADPRIWQYEDLKKSNPAQAKKFIQRQPDPSDLADKADALEKGGLFKK